MERPLHLALADLLVDAGFPSVTICFDVGRGAAVTKEPKARLRSLVKLAESGLHARGVRQPDAKRVLAPAESLLLDPTFWREAPPATVLFLAADGGRRVDLRHRHADFVHVGNEFVVLPVLFDHAFDVRFYLLTLSQRSVALYAGSADRLERLEIDHLPRNAEEALRYDRFEKQLQFHYAGTGRRRGKGLPVYHGIGSGEDGKKASQERFAQIVASAVDSFLAPFESGETPPLVLAGVDYLCALYRSFARYPKVLSDNISGNPEHLPERALHAAALARASAAAGDEQASRRERMETLLASGHAVADLDEIERALAAHSVGELVVVREPAEEALATGKAPTVEALNRLTVRALRARVPVSVTSNVTGPGRTPLVAILRTAQPT